MMCGIAGELQYEYNASYDQKASVQDIERLNQKQYKRGPDSGAIYQINNLVLGHRRLKIFDLSDRAAQPMVDHVLGLALVFNGAIYNFRQLRQELQAKGYHFLSESDTEVLLKAYHAWGTRCITKLQGMFAVAILEMQTGKLILSRDRLGIKPLYYACQANSYCFASTLPALLEFSGINTNIDPAALHYYLTFHAVPEPLTILSGIKKLPPGTIMTVHSDGSIEQENYWRLQINDGFANHERTQDEWLTATKQVLDIAIERQLAADVPVGILLSGGLDSSLLVAIAAQKAAKSIATFSIGFESLQGEQGDEFFYSDRVANYFGTQHQRFFISNKQLTHSLAD